MKLNKNFWEKVFTNPSFNVRFFTVVIFILLVFSFVAYTVFDLVEGISNKLELANLLVQGAILVFGIFAAYYALRQLVETRISSLYNAGTIDLKNGHYLRAIHKWKEAFYIKPDFDIFVNFVEAFLFINEFYEFDRFVWNLETGRHLKQKILNEDSEFLTLFYLKAIRQLLVENLGEAKRQISEIINICKKTNALIQFGWDFNDLKNSEIYKKLSGDSKLITDNLIAYLSKTLSPDQIKAFENGDFTLRSLTNG